MLSQKSFGLEKRVNGWSKTQAPVQPHTPAANLHYPAAGTGAWCYKEPCLTASLHVPRSTVTTTYIYGFLKNHQEEQMSANKLGAPLFRCCVMYSCLQIVLPCIQESSPSLWSPSNLKPVMISGLQKSLDAVKYNYYITVSSSFFSS